MVIICGQMTKAPWTYTDKRNVTFPLTSLFPVYQTNCQDVNVV